MKLKSATILVILLSLAMLFAMVSAAGAEDNGDQIVGNFGFVPNSGEASVSKVDLETYEEIARYYTAPRENPDPDVWRTSRIAQDAEGNAWVLNVGAGGTDLQGAVVRIQANTEGLTSTHLYSESPNPLTFNTDEAVQVFDVGAPGDMPRAIAIDSEGYIWIGFYSGAQLMKYEYNEATKELDVADGPYYPDVSPNNVIRYYEMKFDPDGKLFISSRDSIPTRTPITIGIWTFNGNDFVQETTFNPYSILIADDGTVYATAYDNQLYIRDKDTENWSSIAVGGPQNRGMAFDDFDRIWIASTSGPTGGVFGGTVIYSYNISDGSVGPEYNLLNGTVPVGVGKDYNGVMWAICRSDSLDQGYIEGFNPDDQTFVAAIQVGYRPYAYGDFTQTDLLQEKLTVTKTAETSYNRTHFWDINKSVETENGYKLDDIAKIWLFTNGSGDENATWTVDVSYEGYEDSDFMVCGEITVNNTGTLAANITSAVDELAGIEINVNWVNETDDTVVFPYILESGKKLTGTYCVEGYFEGSNNVTVTTERDFTYDATAPIEWGYPDNETDKTVTVFDEVELGTVTAPYNEQFSYPKNFAWADYDVGETRGFTYKNNASIVETGQYAEATLKVNVQGYDFETAYAKGDNAECFIPTFANWGWTNPIGPGEYAWDLWAGAAQCDTSKGTLVGNVTVVYDADGYVTVEYNVDDPNILMETHVYAGYDMFPQVQRGPRTVSTVAPGQYYNDSPFDGSEVYVIAHAVVGILDVDFGPEP